MKRATRVATVMILAVALFVIGGIGLVRLVGRTDSPAVARSVSAGAADALAGSPAVESGTLARAISSLQARLEAMPQDWRAYASLGLAYVQQARISADPSYYPKAEGVLNRSLALQPRENFQALTGMAALALARHDFGAALQWGNRAKAINPYSSSAHGAVGDALVELGRYDEAFQSFQRMVDLRPGVASYARISYARELIGDVPGALDAMRLAARGAGSRQDMAWAWNQVGDLQFNAGRLEAAEQAYRRARAADRAFTFAAAGLARVNAARGRVDEAIAAYRRVVALSPLPEHVIYLGDLYTSAGREREARRQYDLVRAQETLYTANGVNVDAETALFNADHGLDLTNGLERARAEWRRGRSVTVADTLGWVLHALGRDAEALRYANSALRLGTKSALFHFHRGMIHRSLGHRRLARQDLARALAINPHFSLIWKDSARRVLDSLGGPAGGRGK